MQAAVSSGLALYLTLLCFQNLAQELHHLSLQDVAHWASILELAEKLVKAEDTLIAFNEDNEF